MPASHFHAASASLASLHDAERQLMGEKGDCAVRAVSVACNTPYRVVHEMMAKLGRKHGAGTPRSITDKVIRQLGFATILKSMPEVKTPISFERAVRRCPGLAGRKFLVYSRGHVMGFDGREIIDWAKARRVRVVAIQEVVAADAPAPAPVVINLVTPAPVCPSRKRVRVIHNGITYPNYRAAVRASGIDLATFGAAHHRAKLQASASGSLVIGGAVFTIPA